MLAAESIFYTLRKHDFRHNLPLSLFLYRKANIKIMYDFEG